MAQDWFSFVATICVWMELARIYKLNRNQDQCAFSDFLKLSNNLSVLDGFYVDFLSLFSCFIV